MFTKKTAAPAPVAATVPAKQAKGSNPFSSQNKGAKKKPAKAAGPKPAWSAIADKMLGPKPGC